MKIFFYVLFLVSPLVSLADYKVITVNRYKSESVLVVEDQTGGDKLSSIEIFDFYGEIIKGEIKSLGTKDGVPLYQIRTKPFNAKVGDFLALKKNLNLGEVDSNENKDIKNDNPYGYLSFGFKPIYSLTRDWGMTSEIGVSNQSSLRIDFMLIHDTGPVNNYHYVLDSTIAEISYLYYLYRTQNAWYIGPHLTIADSVVKITNQAGRFDRKKKFSVGGGLKVGYRFGGATSLFLATGLGLSYADMKLNIDTHVIGNSTVRVRKRLHFGYEDLLVVGFNF